MFNFKFTILRRVACSSRGTPQAIPNSLRATHRTGPCKAVHSDAIVYRAKRSSFLNPTMVVLGVIPVFTFALGTWQVKRLGWKVALIQELEGKLALPSLPLPNRVNLDVLSDFTWRKVLLSGQWDFEHAMLLGPRTRDGALGYHLVMPLVRSNGSTVLVDRGFITKEYGDSRTWLRQSNAATNIVGIIRQSQPRNAFTPDNRPDTGEWFWSDVDAMAQFAGGAERDVQPVYLEEIFEGHIGEARSKVENGVPVGRAPGIDLRNQHATYAVTWYSLSAFTAAMFIALVRKGRTTRRRLLH